MNDHEALLPPNLFASYAPRPPDDPRAAAPGLVIRDSTPADRDALARIRWQREGGSLAECTQRFARDLSNHGNPPDDLWLTAEIDGRIVGYGKVSLARPAPDAPPNAAPAGYYLGGVTVDPAYRRRGIAHELTRRRRDWIARRAAEAYYFASALNRASIDLHARFGFVEVTRDFFVPGASFTGGVGILFRIDLRNTQ